MNPKWSQSYSPQPEIHTYLEDVADKFHISQHIEFGKRVNTTRWDEKTQKWTIEVDTGEVLP